LSWPGQRPTEFISTSRLEDYQIFAFIGGFSWGDDHGAGVIFATKLLYNIGEDILRFIEEGNLVIGICNGFQAMVNVGLLPGFDGDYRSRTVALIGNDCGSFRDQWVHLKVETGSPCVFTRGLEHLELPVRHGEGKFYAEESVIKDLEEKHQVVVRYADSDGNLANGSYPENPNGSMNDIAGVCDSTGRVFGLMPHPEAYNHWTNHPNWTLFKERYRRGGEPYPQEGYGIQIFRNSLCVSSVTSMGKEKSGTSRQSTIPRICCLICGGVNISKISFWILATAMWLSWNRNFTWRSKHQHGCDISVTGFTSDKAAEITLAR
jgi:phosphoribosylformylglycinamidine synthase